MRVLRSAFALLALVVLVACSKTAASPSESSTPAASSAALAAASQTLSLTYKSPTVGADVIAKATGLPAGKTVDLTWGTVTGGWVVEDYYRFRGKKYEEATISLGKFTVDSNGALDARFTIPEDYGGVHEVIALIDGKPVAQNGIEVTQSFELTPASGPVGTPLELRVKGLGWRTMESTWVVNWDNNLVGFVSAAGTKGSAVARFRAAGPVGRSRGQDPHRISGSGLSELRAVTRRASPAPAVHVQNDARTSSVADGLCGTVSASASPEDRGARQGCDAESRSDPGPSRLARDAARRRISREHVTAARMADVRGQPRQRQRVRAAGDRNSAA